MKELFKIPVVYEVKGMDKVIVKKDLVYKTTENSELHMDIYAPHSIDKSSSLPAVILVHGEAPIHNVKDAGQYDSLGRLIAASGMIAISFNHRTLVNGAAISEVNYDIDDIFEYVIKNSKSLNIDEDKLAIWAVSLGVPFGLYKGMHKDSNFIKCIVGYYGYGDFKHYKEALNLNLTDEEIQKFSTVDLVEKAKHKIPSIFIARAGLDSQILNESLDEFILYSLKNNLTIDVYNHPDGKHAFDLFNDVERTHTIIKLTLDFLKEHLL